MCRCKKTVPDAITILFVLFTVIAIIAVIYIMFKIKGFDDEKLQTAFIGIVATFVVISNFAQMLEIRNETKAKLYEIENKAKKMRGLDVYYDNSIKKDIAKVLKSYGVNNVFSIDINTMRIKYMGNLVFLVRIMVPERAEDGERDLNKSEYWYYTVNLMNGKASNSSKKDSLLNKSLRFRDWIVNPCQKLPKCHCFGSFCLLSANFFLSLQHDTARKIYC